MSMRWPALICVLLLLGGCHAPPLQEIDQTVSNLASHPWDVAPTHTLEPVDAGPPAAAAAPAAPAPSEDAPQALPPVFDTQPAAAARAAPSAAAPGPRLSSSPPRRDNVVRASFTQPESTAPDQVKQSLQKFELNIPKVVPGSETPLVTLPPDRDPQRPAAIARLFPQLPALPEEPRELPGSDGRPYSLADLQKLAVENSPALRQAISDIEAARGVLKQSVTYPNPTIGFETNPNNNNTGSATMGFFVDQVVKTGGKLTIAGAANLMNLRTAELALKRARSDLATTIRGDYYTLLVAKETVRVNKGAGAVHRRDLPAASRPAGRWVRRQPRAGGPAIAGVPRSPRLSASHCQLRDGLEGACRGHGTQAVAALPGRRPGRSAHPVL